MVSKWLNDQLHGFSWATHLEVNSKEWAIKPNPHSLYAVTVSERYTCIISLDMQLGKRKSTIHTLPVLLLLVSAANRLPVDFSCGMPPANRPPRPCGGCTLFAPVLPTVALPSFGPEAAPAPPVFATEIVNRSQLQMGNTESVEYPENHAISKLKHHGC